MVSACVWVSHGGGTVGQHNFEFPGVVVGAVDVTWKSTVGGTPNYSALLSNVRKYRRAHILNQNVSFDLLDDMV